MSPQPVRFGLVGTGAIAQAFSEFEAARLVAVADVSPTDFHSKRSAAVGSMAAPTWILGFVHAGGGGLALVLEPASALALVELALGGIGSSSASGREPTPLESRVMGNLCSALVEPLSRRSRLARISSHSA